MSDVVVKIKTALPKGQWNGLAPIGDDINDNWQSNVVAIVVLGMPDRKIDAAENVTVDLRILRIEAVTNREEAAVMRGLMRRIHEDRLGVKSLPGMRFDGDLGGLTDVEPEGEDQG